MFFIVTVDTVAQISPGKLFKGHAKLEGMSNCTKCHALGKNVEEKKCLDCHKDLRSIINLKRGYHSNKEVTSKKCWSCHGEHFGKNFEIIRFNEEEFDHLKSGYELVGSHKKLDCNKCHNSNFITNKKLKSKKKTFLGLNKKCLTCHEDEHQGTLDNDCAKCHTINKFSPAEKFNHNETKFVLTGKHKKVDCVKCHKFEKTEKGKFQKFNGLSFNNCSSCHSDVHKGRLGNNCKSCHNTKSFAKVRMSKNFNHNRTNFPLVGNHRKVSCKSCHKKSLSSKPKHKRCLDCHKDYHKGEFLKNNKITDCNECHDEYGFSPSSFTLEQHDTGNFKLQGAHKAVACFACHIKNKKWKFRIAKQKCISCHENVHGNSISKKFFDENKCEQCHTTISWLDIKFEHSKTNFELLGKHKTISCSDCHFEKSKVNDSYKHFIALTSKCTSCHDDIHRGQFADGTIDVCTKCHTNNNWQPTLFNHNQTRFKLDGAHKNVDCSECHKTITDKKGNYVHYKIEDVRCIKCHS